MWTTICISWKEHTYSTGIFSGNDLFNGKHEKKHGKNKKKKKSLSCFCHETCLWPTWKSGWRNLVTLNKIFIFMLLQNTQFWGKFCPVSCRLPPGCPAIAPAPGLFALPHEPADTDQVVWVFPGQLCPTVHLRHLHRLLFVLQTNHKKKTSKTR